ncbi:Quorum-quenching protein AidA [Cupriavidus laharis]|uniref:Quorum-quenching protein AidA n=1 Tax=Cupriavidus laharis TaxID=151654 RepID=A0ABN7Y6G4_9BURK|nr:alpha/beta fold hydrolase [Cupriavidus laharis]CAG9168903.1 Quorum-quenching protein AidA [Cupriavidus laharis]
MHNPCRAMVPESTTLTFDSTFKSHGENCAGTLMVPGAVERPPVIVMGHGFGAIRAAGLSAFARRFIAEGYAVYLFDYRNFGDSEGMPRHWVSPRRHLADWAAAIRHVRTLSGIDTGRIVLWGTSFSGGHVIQTAANDRLIHAVIAQVPHVSAIASLRQVPVRVTIRLMMAALRDHAGRLFGHPHYSRIVGRPGDTAALTTDECWEGYARLLPPAAPWENKVLSRIFLDLPFYNPLRHAHRVKAPTLIVAGRRDTVTPAHAAYRAAMRIPDCEFHLVDGSHFGLHLEDEPACLENIALQLAFLNKQVARPVRCRAAY